METKIKMSYKKLISFITAFSIVLSFFPSALTGEAIGVYEDFENADLNNFTVSRDGGVTISGNENNHYLAISPKNDGTAAFAETALKCENNVPLVISFRFRINSYMQSGQTIAHISKGGLPSVIIETYNGGVAYKNDSGNYVKFLDNAVANKWYEICITSDYSKSTFSIRLDGEDLVRSVANIGFSKGADKISFRAKYSPGIAIDDLSTNVIQNAGEIEINGESTLSVAYDSAAEFDYVIAIYDTNDALIDAPSYQVSVIPSTGGIVPTVNGKAVTLSVASDAQEGDYTLRVIYKNAIKNFHLTLSRYTTQLEKISLSGAGRIAYLEGKENTYPYSVTAFDQNGKVIEGVQVNYFIEGECPPSVSINSQTGVLTVTAPLENNVPIKVMAESTENTNIYSSKKVLLQDEATYIGDETRFRTLLDYIDRAREVGRDPYNGTKLLAKAIDRYTMKPAIWKGLEYDFVPSNLAEQGNWFRTMQGLYNLTGDGQYKQEIDETYDMYLDNYTYDSGAITMGGHLCVDLQTLLPHHGYGSDTLELKSHYPYMEPFWEKSPEEARRFVIKFWEGAVTNWTRLDFNRHIKVYEPYTEVNWDNLTNLWVQPSKLGFNVVATNGVSFRSTASDLVSMGVQLYKNTGELPAKEWARRVLYMYYAATDIETKLQANIFGSRYRFTNNYEYPELAEDHPYWWLKPGEVDKEKLSWWGDRFYVQFYEDFVAKGLVEAVPYEERMDTTKKPPMALEPFYRDALLPDELPAFSDMELAEIWGFDSPEGKLILDYTLTSLQSLYNYGNYSVEDNAVDPLLLDGTSLNGYVSERYGYWANRGSVMERIKLDADFTLSNIRTYLKCKDLEEYSEQLYHIWQFVRGDMAYNGFGEVGIAGPDDNIKLDFSTTSTNPRYAIAFCWLYSATGNADYLEMARLVANNFIKSNMVNGLFTYQPSSHYIEIAGRNGVYPYALALLEATVRGEEDSIPQYYPFHGYYEDRGVLENTGERRTNLHDTNMWNRYNVTAVHITDIIIPEEEIIMKAGEEKTLSISFEPDDATDKSVRITSSDPACVTVDESAKKIYAQKKGSAEIRIISANNKLITKTIKVNVE